MPNRSVHLRRLLVACSVLSLQPTLPVTAAPPIDRGSEIPLSVIEDFSQPGGFEPMPALSRIAATKEEEEAPARSDVEAELQATDPNYQGEQGQGNLSIPSLQGQDGEVVRERFKDGSIQIERQVAQDAKGNYVNHGRYREWDAAGRLIAEGDYVMGVRDGRWMKVFDRKQGTLFQAYPYSEFQAPFVSTAEFLGGHLHGVWAIRDAEGHVISEINFQGGFRDGNARWFHPTSKLMYEASYTGGLLHGVFLERDAEGNELKREIFNKGQRQEVKREYYSNKQLKSEYHLISAPQALKTPDDWWLAKPAEYEVRGEAMKQGAFSLWYENGQLRAKGSYDSGQLHGPFESLHPNGQRESAGEYIGGSQQGAWVWWHANGMKRSAGNYESGKPAGLWSSWQPDGKLIESKQGTGSSSSIPPALSEQRGGGSQLKSQANGSLSPQYYRKR